MSNEHSELSFTAQRIAEESLDDIVYHSANKMTCFALRLMRARQAVKNQSPETQKHIQSELQMEWQELQQSMKWLIG